MNIKRCGICDNCLREKNLTITKEEFENIRKVIKKSIAEKPTNSQELFSHLHNFKQNKILESVTVFAEENNVSITGKD